MDSTTSTDILLSNAVTQLEAISRGLQNVETVLQHRTFFDSQLFAALVGAGVSVVILALQSLYKKWKAYRKRLFKLYEYYAENYVWISPDFIMQSAATHMYGGTLTKDGKTTIFPEKTLTEKMSIRLRQIVKYKTYPISYIRFLFSLYHRQISKITTHARQNAESDVFFIKATKTYEKIKRLCLRKLKEDEWSIRDPH